VATPGVTGAPAHTSCKGVTSWLVFCLSGNGPRRLRRSTWDKGSLCPAFEGSSRRGVCSGGVLAVVIFVPLQQEVVPGEAHTRWKRLFVGYSIICRGLNRTNVEFHTRNFRMRFFILAHYGFQALPELCSNATMRSSVTAKIETAGRCGFHLSTRRLIRTFKPSAAARRPFRRRLAGGTRSRLRR
jgi:hypothetical protein